MNARRIEHALALAGALAVGLRQSGGAFSHPLATGFGDWQMIHHNWEAAWIALTRFHEWPLWDPFHCGGVTILGNPESQLYAPLFWLSFVLGTVLAAKLFACLHVAIAALGMYLLARRSYALDWLPSALSALAWSLSGCIAWDVGGGHATLLPFAFAPLLMLAFRAGLRNPRWLSAVVGLLVLTILEGGTYPFPYFVLLLGFEAVVALSARCVRPGRALAYAGAIALATGLCAAVRLVPIWLTLADIPRTLNSKDALSLPELLRMLTARRHAWRVAGHHFVWPEYGSYLGYGVLALALIGVYASLRARRHLELPAGLLLFGALTLGDVAWFFPWPLLHRLPVFDSLRVPSRFAMLLTLFIALLAGHGLSVLLALARRLHARPRRVAELAALACVAAIAFDLAVVTRPIVNCWNYPELYQGPPAERFYTLSDSEYDQHYASYPRRNVGTIWCYVGGMNWRISPALWIGKRRQVRVLLGPGFVHDSGRTPNRMWAEVELLRPGEIVFNQNYAPGFHSNLGRLHARRGLIAVSLPAGERRVEVQYAPESFVPSVALSALGVLLLCGWAFGPVLVARVRRRRRAPSAPASTSPGS